MSRVVYIDATQKAPNRNGPPQGDVYTIWIENPAGLRTVIYGSRIPKGVLPHDHASRRGTPLEYPLLSVSFGPNAASGGAVGSWAVGVPMYPPGASLSFATTPKLMGVWRCDIPGGIDEILVELLAYFPAAATDVDLTVCVRPLAELGMSPGQGGGVSSAKNWAPLASAEPVRTSFDFTDLTPFGDPALDREVLVELWLAGDPDDLWRLYGLAVLGVELTDDSPGEPDEWGLPRAQVDIGSIQAGQIVLSAIAQQAHIAHNQASMEALGGAPGLQANLDPNVDDPPERIIRRRHRHYGRNYIDPIDGDRVSDGAPPKLPLSSHSGFDDYGESASTLANENPARGYKLHPTDTLATSSGWLQLERRLEPPQGVPSFITRCMIVPGTTVQQCRLWWYFLLRDLDNNALPITLLISGGVSDPDKSSGFDRVLVDPEDGIAWQLNSVRLGQGLGLWTTKARKNPLPSSVRSGDNLARLSRQVQMTYAPTGGPVKLLCAWGLETGAEGSGTYDHAARLNGWDVWAAPGY